MTHLHHLWGGGETTQENKINIMILVFLRSIKKGKTEFLFMF